MHLQPFTFLFVENVSNYATFSPNLWVSDAFVMIFLVNISLKRKKEQIKKHDNVWLQREKRKVY